MKVISTQKAPAAIGPYSQAIKVGNLVYTSGQIPIDPATGSFVEGGIKEQTRQSLTNIKAILEEAGLTMANVVKTTVFMADMADFADMNAVYAEFFSEPYPARSAVAVKSLPKGALVEIEVVGIAKHLGLSGWKVVIGARDEQRAEKAVGELKAQGIDVLGWVNIELKDLNGIERAAQEINEKYPELTLLVNNAGIPGDMSVDSEHTEISVIKETLDVNFIGTFALTKALIPLIAKNSGRIANVTVPSEISPYWHPLAYVASKAAQNAMMGVMATEFQQANTPVETFSVHPGPTTTDLNGNMALPGFHDIETVGQKFAELINDGKNHQGEFIELYPIVKED